MYASECDMHRHMDAVERKLNLEEAFERPDTETPLEMWIAYVATAPIETSLLGKRALEESDYEIGVSEFAEFFRPDPFILPVRPQTA